MKMKAEFVELIETLHGMSMLQAVYLGMMIGFGQIIYDVVKGFFAR